MCNNLTKIYEGLVNVNITQTLCQANLEMSGFYFGLTFCQFFLDNNLCVC